MVHTRGAVLSAQGGLWEVVDLEFPPPGAGEVLVRWAYAGLCYSDEHVRHFDAEGLPIVGGHEGAGVVEAVGEGVESVVVGDHVIASPVPYCGHCRWCATGRSSLCATSHTGGSSPGAEGGFRSAVGAPVRAMCALGTFAEQATVTEQSLVKVDRAVPLDVAALISCGVITGWGAAVRAGQVGPGDTVLVVGAGGVGVNAIQGARHAGAAHVIVADPNGRRADLARRLGATHVVSSAKEAAPLAAALNPTAGGVDVAIVCVADTDPATVREAFDATGKAGTVVLASLSNDFDALSIQIPGSALVVSERRLVGTLMGSTNPAWDIPLLVGLYRSGRLELESLITRRYSLSEINSGFDDMVSGANTRGVIQHGAWNASHSP
jgi:alcohol dehydrogenase (nicotinoprotein)